MRSMPLINGPFLALVLAAVFVVEAVPRTVRGDSLFVANELGTIGEYTTSGATINASLVSGLSNPLAIAVSGSDLFVASGDSGRIGEYTTSGITVNPSLVSGLSEPWGIAVSGSNLFVANYYGGTIGEYTTSGATVNASLISGLSAGGGPEFIAVEANVAPTPAVRNSVVALLAVCGLMGFVRKHPRLD